MGQKSKLDGESSGVGVGAPYLLCKSRATCYFRSKIRWLWTHPKAIKTVFLSKTAKSLISLVCDTKTSPLVVYLAKITSFATRG
eukprot:s64_g10.t1